MPRGRRRAPDRFAAPGGPGPRGVHRRRRRRRRPGLEEAGREPLLPRRLRRDDALQVRRGAGARTEGPGADDAGGPDVELPVGGGSGLLQRRRAPRLPPEAVRPLGPEARDPARRLLRALLISGSISAPIRYNPRGPTYSL